MRVAGSEYRFYKLASALDAPHPTKGCGEAWAGMAPDGMLSSKLLIWCVKRARSSAVEHLTFNQRVVGSIPTGLTTNINNFVRLPEGSIAKADPSKSHVRFFGNESRAPDGLPIGGSFICCAS